MNFKIEKILVLILLLVGTLHCRAAGEIHFREGVAAYEAGQYGPAAQAFRESLAAQMAAGTLLNLGLAEWRQGQPGEAILAWEQSAWLNPFDGNARNNLSYARETSLISPLELTRSELASTWLPANYWAWLASSSLWLAVALVTLPGFFRARKVGWHQTLAVLALGVFILSLAPNLGVITRTEVGIVTDKNTLLRLTPTQSAETVTSLAAGEPIRRLRQRGEYLFVHTPSGNGWVKRQQVKFLCPE